MVALAILLLGGALITGADVPVISAIKDKVLPKPLPKCPLTGLEQKSVPDRPVMAVKVENTSAAYPLVGVDKGEVIYEEIVEGGITRFMVLFQCGTTDRLGPVRSARTTDPRILRQYRDDSPSWGRNTPADQLQPFIAYSGAQLAVDNVIKDLALLPMTESSANPAFSRASYPRSAPHNLFADVATLYSLALRGHAATTAPEPVFQFSEEAPENGKRVGSLSVPFSTSVVADWTWDGAHWKRMIDGMPMTMEDGAPLTVENILIQSVEVQESNLVDVLGYRSPEVTLLGKGTAWLLRGGKVWEGTWKRSVMTKTTVFTTKSGQVMTLRPGKTFIELAPNTETIVFNYIGRQ